MEGPQRFLKPFRRNGWRAKVSVDTVAAVVSCQRIFSGGFRSLRNYSQAEASAETHDCVEELLSLRI